MARKTIDELLAASREHLERLDPPAAAAAMRGGAALVDIRSDSQIAHDGVVPGALVIARNVLEWRLDPDSTHRHPDAPAISERVIVMCNEGYQSSLAAATLQQLGFERATDLAGGFQAWREAGLPVARPDSAPELPTDTAPVPTAAPSPRSRPGRG
jgi:rhodanese-related sulfurtransferase